MEKITPLFSIFHAEAETNFSWLFQLLNHHFLGPFLGFLRRWSEHTPRAYPKLRSPSKTPSLKGILSQTILKSQGVCSRGLFEFSWATYRRLLTWPSALDPTTSKSKFLGFSDALKEPHLFQVSQFHISSPAPIPWCTCSLSSSFSDARRVAWPCDLRSSSSRPSLRSATRRAVAVTRCHPKGHRFFPWLPYKVVPPPVINWL